MEKLANSPLVLVIAQVRIGSVLKMGDYVPEIQEHMRKAGYSLYRPREVHEFEFGPKGAEMRPSQQWAFLNLEQTSGFVIEVGSVSFRTTQYDTHVSFFEEVRRGLQIVDDVVGIDASERFGLRYIDAFQPSDNHNLAEYLAPGLQGVDLDGIGATVPRSMTHLVADTQVGGKLVVRVGLNSSGELPKDLVSEDLHQPKSFDPTVGLGVLDYDHFVLITEKFTVQHAMDRFHELHGLVSEAFESTCSEFAMEEWR